MSETLEDKLEKRQAIKEIKDIFPEYGEYITIQEGEKLKRCKWFGCKEHIHHQFFAKDTERGRERYEVYACERCKKVRGKLVHIQEN